VLLVVVIVVVIHIVVVAATPLRFFKFFAALARLSAFLAVAVHGVAQLILSLVNSLFTFFVSLVSVVRPCWEGRAHQADRQQCKAKNSNHSGHVFSFMNRILSGGQPKGRPL
jgi:NADH:ubiquinone oxidoreductase subunit 5 (subunit L)/multisubunit Na+/H+ antiporter MnhA subunit